MAELFELLLATKRDEFVFPKDCNGAKEGNDGSINNPINLEDAIIDLVMDKNEEETSTEKTNKELHGKKPLAKGKCKDDANSENNKKKDNADSKTDEEAEGKKPLEKTNKEMHGKNLPAKGNNKDESNSDNNKEKVNVDSKTNEEVEGKKPP